MKKAISISNAPAPIGPYSQAILVNDTLYVSGQVPIEPSTGELQMGGIEACTHQVLQNIQALLKEVEMTMENVVKCSVFLKNFNDFNKMNEVYAEYFTSTPPARETVEVVKLPLNAMIEISCIAVK
jgi:2-iminobutanoate/2-iminopropanoate deaminase